MGEVRPYHEWHEAIGDVLWWHWPIESAPYCGRPADLGYTVRVDMGVTSSQVTFEPVEVERQFQIGGWPFSEDEESFLFWTELPDECALDVAIRDYIRGGPDPLAPTTHGGGKA